MQPEPTPDLDEIEACAGLLAAYGAHDSNATMPELLCGAADGARMIREALILIRQARAEGARAARERDELRDELRRTRNNVGGLEEVAGQWMLATKAERARAEKAEARAKELEALLGELLPSTKPCVCRKGVVAPEVCAWCRARAALAKLEGRS